MRGSWRLPIYIPILLNFAIAQVSARPNEPDTSPILRIEMGGHVDSVNGSAIDPEGRWLVTASDDKTARLWEIASGRLIAVLRPPSNGVAGKLRAAAISKNGELIIVGGETDDRWFGGNAAFVFDRQGHLVHVVDGIGERIRSIAITSDGSMFVVGSEGGIQVFNLADFSRVASVAGRSPRDLTVARSGSIAYTAFQDSRDTLVLCQLNSRRLSCDHEVLSQPGFAFSPPAFSDNGSALAVGERYFFLNVQVPDKRASVHLYSAPGLTPIGNLSMERVDSNNFHSLGWTAGDCVVGSAQGLVRFWMAGERRTFHDVAAPISAVVHAFGACGAFILSSGEAASLYRLDAAANTTGPPLVKVRAAVTPVWLGSVTDWRSVAIPRPGQSAAPTFNLRNRAIEGTVPVAYKASGGWTGAGPALLGRQLREGKGLDDLSNTLVLEKRSAVIVSSFDRLELVSAEGSVKWSVPVPNMASRIGLSSDGAVVAGFFPDGVIRWYRFADGKEFLAYFQHPDEKRWVLWTPSGYYDASPGGDGLIGWQVNQGRDRPADFFPVSRFRQTFYRPDVIDKAIDSLDEHEALLGAGGRAGGRDQQASVRKVLPPVVEILAPASPAAVSTPIVPVRISLRSPSDAPVTSVRVRVNGRALEPIDTRDLAVEPLMGGQVRELKVPIPPEDSDILIFAENKNGISTPAVLPIKWSGKPAEPRNEALASRPKLYLLAVGVSEYQNPDFRLSLAAKDAKDFAAAFAGQKEKLYSDIEARVLTDGAATRDAVVDGLEWLQKQVTGRDVGMLFLAGHGLNASDGIYYFAPYNFDLNAIKRTGVAFTEIKNTLSSLAGKALFFVDTCHSGNVLGGRRAIPDLNAVINELSSAENGVVVFLSATGREYAFENPAWGNGAFTKALVEGIMGKADFSHRGRVTHRSLDLYVSERVKQLTEGRQHPVTQAPGGVPDFPIALVGQ